MSEEVVVHMNIEYKDYMDIAFSPDEE